MTQRHDEIEDKVQNLDIDSELCSERRYFWRLRSCHGVEISPSPSPLEEFSGKIIIRYYSKAKIKKNYYYFVTD